MPYCYSSLLQGTKIRRSGKLGHVLECELVLVVLHMPGTLVEQRQSLCVPGGL